MIEPVENTRYELAPLNSADGSAVKVTNDANHDEYYLLEYRVHTGWDEFLPGEGILILHVDYNKYAWNNNTVNNQGRQRMTIIPADNSLSNYSNSTDTWPRNGLDSLTNSSTPAATVYTGGYMNKPITEMKLQDGKAGFWYMKAKGLKGDVNGDGEVNIADVNALIDAVLRGTPPSPNFDINGDGEVNIADINALIDLILRN